MKLKTKLLTGLALISCAGLSSNAMACPGITLPTATTSNTVSFGDALVYSLPILDLKVPSSPGQISDCIVVATGPSGGDLTTNFPGMNDAFATPNAGSNPWFQTGTAVSPDPGGGGGSYVNQPNTWDTSLTALKTFLAGNNPVFYFNHNEQNSGSSIDQNVAIWAQLKLWNTATGAAIYFYATSTFGVPGLENFGKPGDQTALYFGPQTAATCNYPSGADCAPPVLFPTGAILNTGDAGNSASYMINAQGQVCLSGAVGAPGSVPVPCSGPHVAEVNENLGANEAANAILFPELNAILNSPTMGGFNELSIDLRMGCNPTTRIGGGCPLGLDENNGFEQVFIGRANPTACVGPNCGTVTVPEPGTLALFGLGLFAVGLGGLIRRRKI